MSSGERNSLPVFAIEAKNADPQDLEKGIYDIELKIATAPDEFTRNIGRGIQKKAKDRLGSMYGQKRT